MRSSPSYTAFFREQIPAVGHRNQHRLRRLSVAIVGVGGVGSIVAQFLALSGVGELILIDPQAVEISNFNRSIAMSVADVGSPKAKVLANSLGRRPHLRVRPVVASIESAEAQEGLNNADVVCCCSNSVGSRLTTARAAMERGLTCVSAGVADARSTLTARVLVWKPLSTLACEGCFQPFDTTQERVTRSSRGVVLPTVAGVVGAIAAHAIIEPFLLLEGAKTHNLCLVDMTTFSVESLIVRKRNGCCLCTPR